MVLQLAGVIASCSVAVLCAMCLDVMFPSSTSSPSLALIFESRAGRREGDPWERKLVKAKYGIQRNADVVPWAGSFLTVCRRHRMVGLKRNIFVNDGGRQGPLR